MNYLSFTFVILILIGIFNVNISYATTIDVECMKKIFMNSPIPWTNIECYFSKTKRELGLLVINQCKRENNINQKKYNSTVELCDEISYTLINKISESEYIEKIRKCYFNNFAKKDGYISIGEAFDKFFDKPKWSKENDNVIFTGVAEISGKKSLFNIKFLCIVTFQHGEITNISFDNVIVHINNNQINDKSIINDLISSIMLN